MTRIVAERVRHFHSEVPSMRVLRWIILPLLTVHLLLATFSGYRAIWQIQRLDLRASNAVLQPGVTVGFELVSWGRTEAHGQLELIQGAVAETLATTFLPRNGNASYDPRRQRGAASVVLTPSMLSRFVSGSAILRATGYGGMQWLRTPPPTIREQRVRISSTSVDRTSILGTGRASPAKGGGERHEPVGSSARSAKRTSPRPSTSHR